MPENGSATATIFLTSLNVTNDIPASPDTFGTAMAHGPEREKQFNFAVRQALVAVALHGFLSDGLASSGDRPRGQLPCRRPVSAPAVRWIHRTLSSTTLLSNNLSAFRRIWLHAAIHCHPLDERVVGAALECYRGGLEVSVIPYANVTSRKLHLRHDALHCLDRA
ncbi:hypothetical protein Bphy_7708 (plasmid) [Paraburkholderia phymatum STM815]|uniref:Uncharacterized protein n=1 Tax=Paraburkholderia phymatum (strain DSM 17167 / CIP 108236 / LMG 21445 / STM815) TaxID=391038 RepID=B2JY86_PARP8|nr:hypothetical protein Bphy_7708 [Paraburkholderia phymatum STM815]